MRSVQIVIVGRQNTIPPRKQRCGEESHAFLTRSLNRSLQILNQLLGFAVIRLIEQVSHLKNLWKKPSRVARFEHHQVGWNESANNRNDANASGRDQDS